MSERDLLEAQREAASKELDRILAQCVDLDGLATLGTFAAGLSHEINNISTFLLGTTEIMSQDIEQGRSVSQESIDDLSRACQQVVEFGKTIFRMGSIGSPKEARQIDVNEAVREVLGIMRVAGCLKCLTVECDLPDVPTQMLWSRNHLEQVLINLCTNAADALGDTPLGRIDLVVRRNQDNGEIAISIADNGPGMTTEVDGRAFEPFYTTKPRGKGTGLGLPAVKRLVESLGGSISIETAPGRGTTVKLTLPSGK